MSIFSPFRFERLLLTLGGRQRFLGAGCFSFYSPSTGSPHVACRHAQAETGEHPSELPRLLAVPVLVQGIQINRGSVRSCIAVVRPRSLRTEGRVGDRTPFGNMWEMSLRTRSHQMDRLRSDPESRCPLLSFSEVNGNMEVIRANPEPIAII